MVIIITIIRRTRNAAWELFAQKYLPFSIPPPPKYSFSPSFLLSFYSNLKSVNYSVNQKEVWNTQVFWELLRLSVKMRSSLRNEAWGNESSWSMMWDLVSDANASKCRSSEGFHSSVVNNSKFAFAHILLILYILLLCKFIYLNIFYSFSFFFFFDFFIKFKRFTSYQHTRRTKSGFWIAYSATTTFAYSATTTFAYSATTTFYQQHRFYRKTFYCCI